jgi:uncharacterized membrane protein
MKEVFMCASIITAIILCFVGIIKLPFKTFKEKHPKWYRAVFCIMSLGLSVAGPIISQLFILNGTLASTEFVVLLLTTIAGVFGLYTSYEGLGFKQLVKVLVSKVAELFDKFDESKLKKMIGKVGIDKINEVAEKMKVEEVQPVQENAVIESVVETTPQATETVAKANEIKF